MLWLFFPVFFPTAIPTFPSFLEETRPWFFSLSSQTRAPSVTSTLREPLRNHLADSRPIQRALASFGPFAALLPPYPLVCSAATIGTSCLKDGCDAAKVLLECAYEWGIPHIPCADKSRGDGAIPRDFDTLIANATMAQRGVTTGHGCFGPYIPFLYTRHVTVLFLSRLFYCSPVIHWCEGPYLALPC